MLCVQYFVPATFLLCVFGDAACVPMEGAEPCHMITLCLPCCESTLSPPPLLSYNAVFSFASYYSCSFHNCWGMGSLPLLPSLPPASRKPPPRICLSSNF